MRPIYRTSIILVILLISVAALTAAEQPEFAPLFYIGFDGTAEAVAEGSEITVTGADSVKYAEGKFGQAGDFRENGCVEYRGLPPFNLKSGTMELWINAANPATELEDRYYLQFLKDDGSGGIELKFYHVELSMQVIMWSAGKKSRRYGWGWAQDAWRHIAITWDTDDPEISGLKLYYNGVETGYPRGYQQIEMPDFLRIGCKSFAEGLFASALIDEVAVYDRALTRSQVKTLYENGDKPLEARVTAVRERITEEAAVEARKTDLLFNHRNIGMLHGRYQSLLNWSEQVFARLGLPVPEPIHETELTTTDLSRYDALLVGGGGGLRLDDSNAEALRKYVQDGGGYVGICGGAVSAGKYGLIDAERYNFGVRGPVWAKLNEHPVTEGYLASRKVLFPHASGPLFVIKDGSDEVPVVLFDVGNPPLPTFVNVIARKYGEGRVVVFSGHPEGSAETYRMLRNAILWTAKITDVEQPPAP